MSEKAPVLNEERLVDEAQLQDGALFERFRAGDDRAFADLYARHNRRVFYYCIKLVQDRMAAEDILHKAWERVIDLRASETTVLNLSGFLVRMVRNLALDYLKHDKFQRPIEAAAGLAATSERELDELELLVVDCLDRLPIESRELLILHYYSGYTFEEIAAMQGKRVNAVYTRASRARTTLRKELDKRMKSGNRIGKEYV